MSCRQITNIGDQNAEVFYDSGQFTLASGETKVPLSISVAPVDIQTHGSEGLRWRVKDSDWKLHVSMSRDGGKNYHEVGFIRILEGSTIINIWACNNSIVIERFKGKMGIAWGEGDYWFFVCTEGGISESNDPGCMVNYMIE